MKFQAGQAFTAVGGLGTFAGNGFCDERGKDSRNKSIECCSDSTHDGPARRSRENQHVDVLPGYSPNLA